MNKLKLAFGFLSLAFIVSCSDDTSVNFTKSVDIYVAGDFQSVLSTKAVCWKNKSMVVLGDSAAHANSIEVVEGKMYIAGSKDVLPCLWTNNSPKLYGKAETGELLGVFVDKGDVHVAGNFKGPKVTQGRYYKNSNPTALFDSTADGRATGVFVGSKTYVCGTIGKDEVGDPVLWTDGVATILPANSSDVSVVDVTEQFLEPYVLGNEIQGSNLSTPVYWVSGKRFPVYDGIYSAVATSIFCLGTDVYVSGYLNSGDKKVACYWINKRLITLGEMGQESKANSIFIIADDIYVAGSEDGSAVYWKNDEKVVLGKGEAKSIVVTVTFERK